MSKSDSSPLENWIRELETFGRKLQSHAKALLAANDDPFVQRDQIERVAKTIAESDLQSLQAPSEVKESVDSACVEATAEFWQQFSAAAQECGWALHGTTDRRLVSRAYFVELKGDVVTVDGIPGKHSPCVPVLIETLKPYIDKLATDQQSLQGFVEILAQAYDTLGGKGDMNLEAVFRQTVMLSQLPAFWSLMDPAKFQALPRPVFRCRLSNVLEQGVRPKDGREIRLTPSLSRKDVWELFSPAEGHVVQVGRIGFQKN